MRSAAASALLCPALLTRAAALGPAATLLAPLATLAHHSTTGHPLVEGAAMAERVLLVLVGRIPLAPYKNLRLHKLLTSASISAPSGGRHALALSRPGGESLCNSSVGGPRNSVPFPSVGRLVEGGSNYYAGARGFTSSRKLAPPRMLARLDSAQCQGPRGGGGRHSAAAGASLDDYPMPHNGGRRQRGGGRRSWRARARGLSTGWLMCRQCCRRR